MMSNQANYIYTCYKHYFKPSFITGDYPTCCPYCLLVIPSTNHAWSTHVETCPFILNLVHANPYMSCLFPFYDDMIEPNVRKQTLKGKTCYPDKYVHSGFFGVEDKMRCFYCGVSIVYSSLLKDPLHFHFEQNPRCEYVKFHYTKRATKKVGHVLENVPIRHPRNQYLNFESERLKTFDHWPRSCKMNPEILARAGFFYLDEGDLVQCAFCDLQIKDWKFNDMPDIEHGVKNPNCPFITDKSSTENVPIGNLRFNESFDFTFKTEHKTLQNVTKRIETFKTWPHEPTREPKVDDLAINGFYYTNKADIIECFRCALQIDDVKNRSLGEIVKVHENVNPKCGFVLFNSAKRKATETEEKIEEL